MDMGVDWMLPMLQKSPPDVSLHMYGSTRNKADEVGN